MSDKKNYEISPLHDEIEEWLEDLRRKDSNLVYTSVQDIVNEFGITKYDAMRILINYLEGLKSIEAS
jgi:hypothetical protein